MAFFIFVFVVFSAIAAYDAISHGWVVALSLFGSSLLSAFAGAGLRGSIHSGVRATIGGLTMAGVFMAVGQWLGTKYSVGFYGTQLSGHMWSLVGFAIGFFCTSKKFVGGKVSS